MSGCSLWFTLVSLGHKRGVLTTLVWNSRAPLIPLIPERVQMQTALLFEYLGACTIQSSQVLDVVMLVSVARDFWRVAGHESLTPKP